MIPPCSRCGNPEIHGDANDCVSCLVKLVRAREARISHLLEVNAEWSKSGMQKGVALYEAEEALRRADEANGKLLRSMPAVPSVSEPIMKPFVTSVCSAGDAHEQCLSIKCECTCHPENRPSEARAACGCPWPPSCDHENRHRAGRLIAAHPVQRANEARASAECPICGHDSSHAHSKEEVEQWATNQVARWGYKVHLGSAPPRAEVEKALAEALIEVRDAGPRCPDCGSSGMCQESCIIFRALRKYEAQRSDKASPEPFPTFEQAWEKMKAEGYQYGPDALEHVRFGWEIHEAVCDERAAKGCSETALLEAVRTFIDRQDFWLEIRGRALVPADWKEAYDAMRAALTGSEGGR